MALTTSTTVSTHILAKYVEDSIRESLKAALVLPKFITQYDLRGKNSKVWSSNIWPTLSAAAVAESTDLTNTTVTLTAADITASEVGIEIDVTDLSVESSNITPDAYARQGMYAIQQKIETDIAALFSGLSTTAGTTNVELTLDALVGAIQSLETANAVGPAVVVLHPKQAGVLRKLIAGTSGSTAAFFGAGSIDPSFKQVPGFVMDFLGRPVFQSSVVGTVNAAVDYCGAVFTQEAFGMAILRDIKVEAERNASARVTELNITTAYGVGELNDSCGVRIISRVA